MKTHLRTVLLWWLLLSAASLLILYASASVVLAQEIVPGEVEVRDLANTLIDTVINSAIGTGTVVLLTVQLLKVLPVPFLRQAQATHINFVVAIVYSLVVAAATYLNAGVQFGEFLRVYEQLVPLIVSVVAAFTGAHVQFSAYKALKIPVVGHSRTP